MFYGNARDSLLAYVRGEAFLTSICQKQARNAYSDKLRGIVTLDSDNGKQVVFSEIVFGVLA